MASSSSKTGFHPLALGADWLASKEGLPVSIRAIFSYYAETGDFDYRSLKIKSYVDDEIGEIIDEAYSVIEQEIADEYDRPAVDFEYETKLTLPAELTLGYLYRRVLEDSPSNYNPITRTAKTEKIEYFRIPFDKKRERRRNQRLTERNQHLVDRVEEIERITRLVVEALIDGDMRDALNDEEYGDFSVDFELDTRLKQRRVAEIAQQTLQTSIETRLVEFPTPVQEAYKSAVEVSEGHQDLDTKYRALLDQEDSVEAIREEYKHADFEYPPEVFNAVALELPYLKTQYDRVGVIYDGMIEMYRSAGFHIDQDFKRAIVLSIIGAQIWLDDVSDYFEDSEEGQLTPVTAEYELASSAAAARSNVIEISGMYLDHAKEYAAESGTPMIGIAIEYISHLGDPSNLPQ